jgi:N-formylglutamate amidohydrolase
MARETLTDAEVEKEIEKLLDSYHVQLAKKEERIRYRRRQYLYQLRNLEKHGKELEKAGITPEILDGIDSGGTEE